MNSLRINLYAGLLYSLPICVWLLAQLDTASLEPEAVGGLMRQAAAALLLVQLLVLSIRLPAMPTPGGGQRRLQALLMLTTVPLPLLTIFWLSGAMDGAILLLSQVMVMGFGLLALGLGRVIVLLPPGTVRGPAWGSLQVTLALAVWQLRHHWLSWLGLG